MRVESRERDVEVEGANRSGARRMCSSKNSWFVAAEHMRMHIFHTHGQDWHRWIKCDNINASFVFS